MSKQNNIEETEYTYKIRQDAKIMVDIMFDIKIFKDKITRDDMNRFEQFISNMMNIRFNNYIKTEKLMRDLDLHKAVNNLKENGREVKK